MASFPLMIPNGPSIRAGAAQIAAILPPLSQWFFMIFCMLSLGLTAGWSQPVNEFRLQVGNGHISDDELAGRTFYEPVVAH